MTLSVMTGVVLLFASQMTDVPTVEAEAEAGVATEVEVAPAPVPTPAAALPAQVDERLRILVLNVGARGVPASAAETIEGLLTVKLSEREQLNVVSRADLAAALSMEADREAMGCNETSCLGEIAGALDARLVVYGDIAKIEDELVVTVSLFDAEQARALSREVLRAKKLLDIADRLSALVTNLLAPLLGHERVVVAPVVAEGFTKNDYIRGGGITVGIVGSAMAGVGVLTGGMAWFAELVSVAIDEPDSDAGFVALLTPIAGPLLYAAIEPQYASDPLQLGLLIAGFAFQFMGATLAVAGLIVAVGGFTGASVLPQEEGLE